MIQRLRDELAMELRDYRNLERACVDDVSRHLRGRCDGLLRALRIMGAVDERQYNWLKERVK